jgi:hypothetical protein
MKNLKGFRLFILLFLVLPASTFAQNDFCSAFNKVKLTMEEGFNSVKGPKTTETTNDYGMMTVNTKKWSSKFLFPEAIFADVTEILRVAPDPNNAGHNIYITFNFAKNSPRAVAEAAFNKLRDNMKLCNPANWKVEEKSGSTYARYTLMTGSNYDSSPRKITLQFNKLDGPGDRYTADLIFDSAVK